MHWADLARYWLGPEGEPRSQESAREFSELPPGITDKAFDFVILGASVIYSDTPDNRSDIDRLPAHGTVDYWAPGHLSRRYDHRETCACRTCHDSECFIPVAHPLDQTMGNKADEAAL